MPARLLIPSILLVSLLLLIPSPLPAQSSATSNAQEQRTAQVSDPADDLAAMKADLAKMRVLVTQMQNNLGLTTNTTTPLYHQFELEINMWQLLIAQMERRLEHMERSQRTSRRD